MGCPSTELVYSSPLIKKIMLSASLLTMLDEITVGRFIAFYLLLSTSSQREMPVGAIALLTTGFSSG